MITEQLLTGRFAVW